MEQSMSIQLTPHNPFRDFLWSPNRSFQHKKLINNCFLWAKKLENDIITSTLILSHYRKTKTSQQLLLTITDSTASPKKQLII